MRDAVALQRYLQRHIEPGAASFTALASRWQQVLVIPAYRESPQLLQHLVDAPRCSGKLLIVLVLNRPAGDDDARANSALRDAVLALPNEALPGAGNIHRAGAGTDILLHDMELAGGALPRGRGVGLARKAGCDIALRAIADGAVCGNWICSTDADSRLPASYFEQLAAAPRDAVAAVFPFLHLPAREHAVTLATGLYELRMHHYLLGLGYAGSPYACHSLGSCLAVRAAAYAHVRGFPRRDGAEDFYLLNKLAKLGPVARLEGNCIRLQARASRRVPFGTGPAVAAIATAPDPVDLPLFYHPQSFAALRAVLQAVATMAASRRETLAGALAAHGLAAGLARQVESALLRLGMEKALAHCRRQSNSPQQFLRHFHQWFDALRTLQFCHTLRDKGWPQQSLAGLAQLAPWLWPPEATPGAGHDELLAAVRRHWRWRDGGTVTPGAGFNSAAQLDTIGHDLGTSPQ